MFMNTYKPLKLIGRLFALLKEAKSWPRGPFLII